MAIIKADTRITRSFSSDFLQVSKSVEKDARTVSSVIAKLDKNVKARSNISAQLNDMYKALTDIVKALQNASVITTDSAVELAGAEARSAQMADGITTAGGAAAASVMGGGAGTQNRNAGSQSPNSGISSPGQGDGRPNTPAAKPDETARLKSEIKHAETHTDRTYTPVETTARTINFGKPAASSPQTTTGNIMNTGKTPASTVSAPGSLKEKINSGIKSAETKVRDVVDEKKDAWAGAAMQAATGLGYTAAGAGLGAGVKFVADKLGIPGGAASAQTDFKLTGLETSTVYRVGDTLATASAKLGDINASAKASAVFNPAGGNIGASADASFSVTGAKAGASYQNSFANLSAEAMVGAVSGNASADVSLMKDGKVNPAVYASVNAEVAAAKGIISAGVHKDGYSLAGKAEGAVASARAGADANFDLSKSKVWVGAGAMAAAAKGTVSGAADLGPVKVSGKLTGYAGAAGVEVGAGLVDGQLKFHVGAALGAGAKAEIGIGAGNWLPKIDKALEGAVGEGLSAVSSAANVVLAPVGAVVSTAKNAVDSFKDIGKGITKGDAKAVVQGIGKLATGTGKAIVDAGKTVVKSAGKAVVSAGKAVGSVAKAIGKAFTSW